MRDTDVTAFTSMWKAPTLGQLKADDEASWLIVGYTGNTLDAPKKPRVINLQLSGAIR
jgi:hypothetical protein